MKSYKKTSSLAFLPEFAETIPFSSRIKITDVWCSLFIGALRIPIAVLKPKMFSKCFQIIGAIVAWTMVTQSATGAEHTKKENDAVSDFLETYKLLFSSPCNTPTGANDIANKLEVKLTNDLDSRFMEYGLSVVGVMRTLGAGVAKQNVSKEILNGAIAYFGGSAPAIDFGDTFKDDVEFKKKIAIISTNSISLQLLAEKEFGYDANLNRHYTWTWQDGVFTDDFTLTNKNRVAWKDVTISFAYFSGVSRTWNKTNPLFKFASVEPGQTLRFDNLFMSSELCGGHIVSILIKTSDGTCLRTWKCLSDSNPVTAKIYGHTYYFEYLPKVYYSSAGKRFYTLDGAIPSVVSE